EITVYIFFFSSRRRHTRSKRDWSSDVCSSDLPFFQQVTVCHTSWEEGVGHGGFFIGVRVEGIAGFFRKSQDFLKGDLAQFRGELVANLERCQILAERVHAGAVGDILAGHAVHRCAAVPLANHSSQVIRAALNCGALHVVQDAADTAELLTTACTTWAAVDQVWQRGAVAGGSLRIHAV